MIALAKTKECRLCGEPKSAEEFCKSNGDKCSKCDKRYAVAWGKSRREHVLAYGSADEIEALRQSNREAQRRWMQSPKGLAKTERLKAERRERREQKKAESIRRRTRTCEQCGQQFIQKDRKKRIQRYCSYKCYHASPEHLSKPQINKPGPKIETPCGHCGIIVTVCPSQQKRGEGKYCSPGCYAEGQKAATAKKMATELALAKCAACGGAVEWGNGSPRKVCGTCCEKYGRPPRGINWAEWKRLNDEHDIEWTNRLLWCWSHYQKKQKTRTAYADPWTRKFSNILSSVYQRKRHHKPKDKQSKWPPPTMWEDAFVKALQRERGRLKRKRANAENPWRLKFETMSRNWQRKAGARADG